MKNGNKIEFEKIPIGVSYGKIINDIFIVIKNGRCKVLDALSSLEKKSEMILLILFQD